MDSILWTDLNSEEQRAIAMLGSGFSAQLCDPIALLTLKNIGLVRGAQLTSAGDRLRREAALQELAVHILQELAV